MPDVHVPGIGNVPRGGVIAGMLLGAGGGLYLWWKHKQNAAAAATPASSAYGYGSQYGYGGYGYNNPAFNEPYIGGEYGYGGAYGYGIGEGYGVGTPYPPPVPSQLATTNQAWAQAAEQYLTNSGGYDPGTVAAALGVYINGSTLTADQQSVVEAAIAFEGYPPQPGTNGYPPAMHTTTPPGAGNPPPAAGQVAVPNVVGKRVIVANPIIKAAGLKAVYPSGAKGVAQYVKATSPGAGTKVAKGSTVTYSIGPKTAAA